MYFSLREQLVVAVLDDGFAGDQSDKRAVIIHHGDKILVGGTLNHIVHGRCDPDRNVILAPGDLHDPPGFRLAHIHVAHILHSP